MAYEVVGAVVSVVVSVVVGVVVRIVVRIGVGVAVGVVDGVVGSWLVKDRLDGGWSGHFRSVGLRFGDRRQIDGAVSGEAFE